MGKVINIKDRLYKRPAGLICTKPFEFRKADWTTLNFIQMTKSQSAKLDRRREEIRKKGGKGITHLPPNFSLKGGIAYTIQAIFAYRENEARMREVYYLTGLMDCMINRINPILRTDLLRGMYKEIFYLKEKLNVHWYLSLDQVLLPIDPQFFNECEYHSLLSGSQSLKELYQAIRNGTDEMFDILSIEYVFYCPWAGGN